MQSLNPESITPELLAANAALAIEIAERKQIEAQLNETQRRLELSLKGANLGTWTYRVGTDEFWADDRALQLHGHAAGETNTFAEAGANIHPEDYDRGQAAFATAFQTRANLEIEYRVVWRDGSVHWVASYAEFVPGDRPDEGVFYGVVQDITAAKRDQRERIQTETALRETETRLRVMIQHLPGGAAFVVDRDLRYLLAEGEALSIAGFKPEDLVGKTIAEAMPPELVARYEAVYRGGLAGEAFEFEHDAHDRFYISRGTPLRSENGEIYAVLAVSYDITDRKQAEIALRESEERLRLAIEAAQMYAWEFDLRTNTPKFSENAEQVIGRSPADSFEENLEQVHPDDRAVVRQAFADALTNGDRFEYEMRSFTPDNQLQWFLVIGSLIRDAENQPIRAIGISQNITERKQFEEALQTANERFQIAESAANGFVYDWNRQTGIVTRSAGFNQVLGYEPGEIAETPDGWFELVHPDDRAVLQVVSPAAMDAGQTHFAVEYRVRHKDGTDRDVFDRALMLRDSSGAVVRIVGSTVDITDRKQTEAALRESEQKYHKLFDSIDEGLAIVEMIDDDQGEIVDIIYRQVNRAYERQGGVYDVVGRSIFDVIPGVEDYWLDLYKRVAKMGESVREENYQQDVDRWFDVHFSRIDDTGRFVAIVFNDISDRKQAEAQLRRAAEMDAFRVKLTDALRSLADPIEIQRTAMRVLGEHLQVDRVMYAEIDDGETYSIAANYVRGAYPALVGRFPTSDFGTVSERLRAGETFAVENMTTDERLSEAARAAFIAFDVYASVGVPLIKAGRWVANLGIQHGQARQWTEEDIELVQETAERTWAAVERARAEIDLRESELQRVREQAAREQEHQRAESLAELDRAKTLFFSNVSHEFRTPLTLLLAPLQEVLSDRTLSPAHQERLELAHRNSLRLLKLVNTLLDFSRIEAGRMAAVYEPIDLAQLTTELASVFRSAIEQSGLRLVVDCPPLSKSVYVDREMWEKIVLNLLSNAFKFTFTGEITVRLQSENDCAIVQIADTGTGIAPEHLPHLFERFYQVRGAQARTHEGSGIGLALVYELVRLQGGSIEVTSTVNVGTCFTIALPFGTNHLPSERIELDRTFASTAMNAVSYVEEAERWLLTENAEELNTSAIAARVLLVDDNADMREYLTRILSEQVQVEAVADGMTALRMAQAQIPDLILSDVMMPELDGFGLLQALRSDPRTREIPIILLSARAGEEAIVEGLEAGADDYLIKPFSAQELVSRVNAHLQIAQLRTTALQEARSTIQNRDELLSTVSHELNTPLVSILGWTRLLRSNPPSPSILNKALDTIERNATVQAALVQDLLDMSRITVGKLRLNLQPVELQSIVEIAIATVTQTAEAKSIDLVWQPDHDAFVMGDRDRLQQVFCNVLTNAIKFTPAGGRVTIELSTSLDRAEIRVIDTGIGISADFLPRVFDRFQQARASDAAKGLGVGLAIARHIVELHNGTIHAESAGVGQGATFTVRLPLAQECES